MSTVRMLKRMDLDDVTKTLRNESRRMEVTKSLLNILFNICFTKAVPLTQRQKNAFKVHHKLVVEILTDARDPANLVEKKRLLEQNPELVQLIAATCPPLPARVV